MRQQHNLLLPSLSSSDAALIMAKQLLWLLLWACVSFSAVLTSRLLLHYRGFAVPCFLALLTTAAIAVVARVLVFLTTTSSGSEDTVTSTATTSSRSLREWLHVGAVVGGLSGASLALQLAALRYLPVPSVILLQALSPAVSYWLAVLLGQEDMEWVAAAKAVTAFCSVCAGLFPQRGISISAAGLALQLSALLADILWQRLHLYYYSSMSSSVDNTATMQQHPHPQPPAPLVLLADASPAAALVLLLPMLVLDLQQWTVQQYRLRPAMPLAGVACMLLCCLLLLKVQQPVMHGLVQDPAGPFVRSLRDGLLGLVAAKLLNEHMGGWQWAAYGVAQAAGVALWWQRGVCGSRGASINGCGSGRQSGLGFSKLQPVLG